MDRNDVYNIVRKYPITVERDESERYFAYAIAFPGIMSDGYMIDYVVEDLFSLLNNVVERRIEEGRELPPTERLCDW